jgi:hypothetical protein
VLKDFAPNLKNEKGNINSVSLCVYDEGFGGWGKGEADEVAGDPCLSVVFVFNFFPLSWTSFANCT